MKVEKEYIVQLDGFRFMAVLAVMFGHWLAYPFLYEFNDFIKTSGVNLFFVLSGFLITRILINNKEEGRSKGFVLRQFYIRRSLRIFPIYYLVIFAGYLFSIPTARENFLWLLTYTTNIILPFRDGQFGYFPHLWSLGVEEQFYLIFPFIVLFIPNKHLLKVFISIAVLAILSRMLPGIIYPDKDLRLFTYTLTPCCFDCFAIGAILAYMAIFNQEALIKLLDKSYIFLICLIICIAFTIYTSYNKYSITAVSFIRFTFSIFCFWIIGLAAFNKIRGVFKFFLEHPLVIYLGRISYGLYVYHYFVPLLFIYLHGGSLSYFRFSIMVYSVLYFITSVIIAAISWHLIENPVNNLKRYFRYNGGAIEVLNYNFRKMIK
jgi:peptidoglycan/LPS O-acetylase OafA/YrhL